MTVSAVSRVSKGAHGSVLSLGVHVRVENLRSGLTSEVFPQMKHRKPDDERETSPAPNQQREVASEVSSPGESGVVASLHRAGGNQAIKQLHERGALQASVDVSHPRDRAEREAERVAEEVLRGEESPRGSRMQTVTRRTSNETDRTRTLHRGAEAEIQAVTSGGRPLPESTRSFFESRLSRDFSDVRVHTGSRADEAARSIDAEAFTHGTNVVFRNGRYDPETTRGRRLIAHELIHVVQQGAADPRRDADGPATRSPVSASGTTADVLPQTAESSERSAAGESDRAAAARDDGAGGVVETLRTERAAYRRTLKLVESFVESSRAIESSIQRSSPNFAQALSQVEGAYSTILKARDEYRKAVIAAGSRPSVEIPAAGSANETSQGGSGGAMTTGGNIIVNPDREPTTSAPRRHVATESYEVRSQLETRLQQAADTFAHAIEPTKFAGKSLFAYTRRDVSVSDVVEVPTVATPKELVSFVANKRAEKRTMLETGRRVLRYVKSNPVDTRVAKQSRGGEVAGASGRQPRSRSVGGRVSEANSARAAAAVGERIHGMIDGFQGVDFVFLARLSYHELNGGGKLFEQHGSEASERAMEAIYGGSSTTAGGQEPRSQLHDEYARIAGEKEPGASKMTNSFDLSDGLQNDELGDFFLQAVHQLAGQSGDRGVVQLDLTIRNPPYTLNFTLRGELHNEGRGSDENDRDDIVAKIRFLAGGGLSTEGTPLEWAVDLSVTIQAGVQLSVRGDGAEEVFTHFLDAAYSLIAEEVAQDAAKFLFGNREVAKSDRTEGDWDEDDYARAGLVGQGSLEAASSSGDNGVGVSAGVTGRTVRGMQFEQADEDDDLERTGFSKNVLSVNAAVSGGGYRGSISGYLTWLKIAQADRMGLENYRRYTNSTSITLACTVDGLDSFAKQFAAQAPAELIDIAGSLKQAMGSKDRASRPEVGTTAVSSTAEFAAKHALEQKKGEIASELASWADETAKPLAEGAGITSSYTTTDSGTSLKTRLVFSWTETGIRKDGDGWDRDVSGTVELQKTDITQAELDTGAAKTEVSIESRDRLLVIDLG
jgi:hypothetical protein